MPRQRVDLKKAYTIETVFSVCMVYNPQIFKEPGVLLVHNDDNALDGGTAGWQQSDKTKPPGFGCPGGGVESDSRESLEAAAKREIFSETGLVAKSVTLLESFRKSITEPRYGTAGKSRIVTLKWSDSTLVYVCTNREIHTHNPVHFFEADVEFNGTMLEKRFIDLKNKLMERSTPIQMEKRIQESGLVLKFTPDEGRALGIEEINEISGMGFFPFSYLVWRKNMGDPNIKKGDQDYFYWLHLQCFEKYVPDLLKKMYVKIAAQSAIPAPPFICEEEEVEEEDWNNAI